MALPFSPSEATTRRAPASEAMSGEAAPPEDPPSDRSKVEKEVTLVCSSKTCESVSRKTDLPLAPSPLKTAMTESVVWPVMAYPMRTWR